MLSVCLENAVLIDSSNTGCNFTQSKFLDFSEILENLKDGRMGQTQLRRETWRAGFISLFY